MKYTTILFDADGTLFDFLHAEKEALCETFSSFGIDLDEERISSYSEINDGLWKALERGEIEKEVLRYKRFELFCKKHELNCDTAKISSLYTQNLSTKGHLIDGADDLCRNLYGKAKLYIVTNGIGFVQKGRMAKSGISKYFETTFISEEIGCEKPDVKYFDHVSEHIDGFNKNSTLIVGDSLTSDIKGGILFGIDTCWYNPKNKAVPDGMNITYVTGNFNEIYDVIMNESEK